MSSCATARLRRIVANAAEVWRGRFRPLRSRMRDDRNVRYGLMAIHEWTAHVLLGVVAACLIERLDEVLRPAPSLVYSRLLQVVPLGVRASPIQVRIERAGQHS